MPFVEGESLRSFETHRKTRSFTAQVLGISPATVKREWTLARLRRELADRS